MAQKEDNQLNQNNLYLRLIPAFNTKIKEWKREKINNINKLALWNYCIITKWQGKKDLRMYELVDDILNIDLIDFLRFIKEDKDSDKNAR